MTTQTMDAQIEELLRMDPERFETALDHVRGQVAELNEEFGPIALESGQIGGEVLARASVFEEAAQLRASDDAPSEGGARFDAFTDDLVGATLMPLSRAS